MNNPNPDSKPVIDAAKFVFAGNWSGELNEGKASTESKVITKVWQDRMTVIAPEKYKKNVSIWSQTKDTIDLVDFQEKVAYELKVSGKNSGHEFYKNLFKVLIYNQHHNVIKLNRLVFITQSKGIDELEHGLGKAAADFLMQFNITVELARLD